MSLKVFKCNLIALTYCYVKEYYIIIKIQVKIMLSQ